MHSFGTYICLSLRFYLYGWNIKYSRMEHNGMKKTKHNGIKISFYCLNMNNVSIPLFEKLDGKKQA
jgi:hypothetical protein